MSNEPILKIRDLQYTYSSGDHQALKGINLDVMPGERICIVGNNGAGKSTFFLNVNGVLHPDAGEIYFKGEKITDKKESLNELRRGVGIVFQDADNQIIATGTPVEVLKNRAVCEQANLRKPMLMRVYEDMVKHGIAPDDNAYPQDVEAFDAWLDKIKAS